uniref:TTF-type domain-containing protein n=1 Tax=Paramormyrops kingsleyae TaxID=1676925 RepID=A0A3B3RLL1_9TELE
REPRGEHPALREVEDAEEEAEAEHDKDRQAQTASVRDEDEEYQTADQEQAATMVREARQDLAKAGVRPVPGPTGEVMTVMKWITRPDISVLCNIIWGDQLIIVIIYIIMIDFASCFITYISKSRAEQPKQPQLKSFPRTYQGDRRRCFSKDWYNTHKWLEYSQSKDSAYCYACRQFSLPSSGDSVFTSEEGFKNWKKATYKDGGLIGHAKSEVHTNAMLAWAEHYIKTVAEILLFTATQNIAQRAHRESESDNKGNFLCIMELLAKHDPIVKRKMTSQRNATYLGHATQNEIIDCLAEMVRTSIISEVVQSEAFSILTKDLSKKEQMSFVIRYYYNGSVCESFLAFEAAERLDAAALSQKIVQILQKYGLDYKNHLVGQAYDGASVMSGKNTGVQARFKAEAPLAFYVHCNAHCLNLVLVDSVKCIPGAYCFFSLLQKLYVFVSWSYVHQKWLEVQREMFQGAPRELQRLIETRWACRYNACMTVRDRLPAIIRLLKEISEEPNGDRAVEARCLLAQIDLKFVGLLATFTGVFGEIKYLSGILQSPQLNLGTAVTLVDSLVEILDSYREGPVFNDIWDKTDPCQAMQHQYGSTQSFRAGLFIPIIDMLLSEVKRRFSKENCVTLQGIQYNCSTEDLQYKIPQLKQILERKRTNGLETPNSLIDLTMFKLCKIALALPVNTASCECSFSVIMTDERLSNLGVLSVESRRARAINLDDFVDLFAKKHSNRRIKLY